MNFQKKIISSAKSGFASRDLGWFLSLATTSCTFSGRGPKKLCREPAPRFAAGAAAAFFFAAAGDDAGAGSGAGFGALVARFDIEPYSDLSAT